MSRSFSPGSADRNWLQTPIYDDDRVPLQPRKSWVTALELVLLTLALLVIGFNLF